MSKYRIVEYKLKGMKLPRYYIERKGWFLWSKVRQHYFSNNGFSRYFVNSYFNTFSDAYEALRQVEERDRSKDYEKIVWESKK